MNTPAAPGNAESADALHEGWAAKRDQAVVDWVAALQGNIPHWFALADSAEQPDDRATGAALVRLATVAAGCAGGHAAAAEGYFRLAKAIHPGAEPAAAARRWYARSLEHAEQASGSFEIARAAYCVGVIDETARRLDDAEAKFKQVLEHTQGAGNPGGHAAALYHLALIAMARHAPATAVEHAVQSYMVSRDAKQYLPASQTLTRLFEFLAGLGLGLDDLAEKLGLELLSITVIAPSERAEDAGNVGAALRAVAALNAETRATILRHLGVRFGDEVALSLGRELDTTIALLAAQQQPPAEG